MARASAARWVSLVVVLLFAGFASGLTTDDAAPTDGGALPLPDVAGRYLSFEEAWPRRIRPADTSSDGVLLRLPTPRAVWAPQRIGLVQPGDAGISELKLWLGEHYPAMVKFEGMNAFVPRLIPVEAERNTGIAGTFWIHASLRPTAGRADRAELERTAFVVLDPIGVDADGTRGVCLFMPGLFGTPEGIIELSVRRLRRDGWTVVRMLAQPSRFTERAEFKFDPGEDPVAIARPIAEEIRERVAECAFAAHGVLERIESERPKLRELPRLAFGFSGGAMTLPTVVARDPERYDAAIMVGGGAQFWLLITRSNYANWIDSFRLDWGGESPPQAELAAISQAYLDLNPLDSFHTAAALRAKPVLMILGEHDRAVPAALGEVLWQRLPDKHAASELWKKPHGHELLFMALPRDLDAISGWIEKVIPRPGVAEPERPAAAP